MTSQPAQVTQEEAHCSISDEKERVSELMVPTRSSPESGKPSRSCGSALVFNAFTI